METLTKFQIFNQNHGVTPLQKCQFCGFLNPMFSLFRKACLLYKTSKTVFSRSIFTIYDMGIGGLKGVKGRFKGLQGVTGGYKVLQGVTGDEKGLQGVTKNQRNVFLTRTFPPTFSWSILNKNQR